MALDRTSVAVILDPDFGWEIRSLAETMPVHVVDSPTNRPAIESIWNDRRTQRLDREVTVFRSIPGIPPEELLATIVRSLVPDHGRARTDEGVLTIRIRGLPLTPATETALLALGLASMRPVAGGFDAIVRPSEGDPSAGPRKAGS